MQPIMTSRKKSRKPGAIGTPSVPKDQRTHSSSRKKPAKKTGNPSGSRHSVAQEQNITGKKEHKDPRHGSKKPVPLVVAPKPTKAAKKTYFSPAQELEAIENDTRLSALLDKLDKGKALSIAQQQFVDDTLARHKVLCELLGIREEEESPEAPDSDDPFERFDAIDINDFKEE